MKRNLILSIVLLACLSVLYWSLSLMEDPRAIIFPRVLIIIMFALSAGLLLQTLIAGHDGQRPTLQSDRVQNSDDMAKTRHPYVIVSACFLLILIYLALMERLGFYASAFLFFLAVVFIFGREGLTLRKGLTRVGIVLLFTGILYVLFNRILMVQTPKGILF
ncbi:MAG: tripartite tricarboxylate transporter TctB family protein [Deltaproteobacteria bacterium]|nr:tripartite tricarboxylate transporter TctB family protein [Deltaproteobacteria bacterium]